MTAPVMNMACAVCGVPCEYVRTRDGEEGYAHARPSDLADHVCIPVPADSLPSLTIRCDICDKTQAPWWVLPVEPYVMLLMVNPDTGDAQAFNNNGDWQVCDQCAPLVRRRKWARIVRQRLEGVSEAEQAKLAGMYVRMFAELDGHITGELHRDPRPGVE